MATHPHEPHEEHRDDHPRSLERERQHRPHDDARAGGHRETAAPDAPSRPQEPDGGVVRSEPAAARTGDGHPGSHENRNHGPHEDVYAQHGDGPGGVHGHAEDGDRLIPVSESEELRRRWESIQAAFIDSPRESVQEADRLVGELTDRTTERFRSERSGLDAHWERGDEVSTEDLRLTLQRYRGFFDRLLHL